MKVKKYRLKVMMILLSTTLSFIGCAEQRVRPPAETMCYFVDTLEELKPLAEELSSFKDFLRKEYAAALDEESALISSLTDQELQSYEEYTRALDSGDSQATLEKTKRGLKRNLRPEKLQTAMELCDLKVGLQHSINQISDEQRQIINEVKYIERQLDNAQFTRFGLSKRDYEEMERLKKVIDEYRLFVENTVSKYIPKDKPNNNQIGNR